MVLATTLLGLSGDYVKTGTAGLWAVYYDLSDTSAMRAADVHDKRLLDLSILRTLSSI